MCVLVCSKRVMSVSHPYKLVHSEHDLAVTWHPTNVLLFSISTTCAFRWCHTCRRTSSMLLFLHFIAWQWVLSGEMFYPAAFCILSRILSILFYWTWHILIFIIQMSQVIKSMSHSGISSDVKMVNTGNTILFRHQGHKKASEWKN